MRDGEGLGRRRGQAVLLQVCLWCCCSNVLLLVIALARWGSGANVINLVSVVIAVQETVVRKGKAGWGRADALALFFAISSGCTLLLVTFACPRTVPTSTADR